VHCLDGQTGKTVWSGAVEKNRNAFSASPVLAGGRLYITREDGTTFVLSQGEKFEQLAQNELEGEFVVATPVFVDGRIYIRTRERLYAIGG
jgi:outer membrane protein assembly factor BamB